MARTAYSYKGQLTLWSDNELSGLITLSLLTREPQACLLIMEDPTPESYTMWNRL
jgi:hypothetical protein